MKDQGCRHESPVGAVDPAVIGTDEPHGVTALFERDRHVAVAADVREPSDHAVGAVNHENGFVENPGGEPVAPPRQVVGTADQKPFALEDRFDLESVEIGIGIGIRWQCPAGRILGSRIAGQCVEEPIEGGRHRTRSSIRV